ncbi:MAG: hypothetical protein Q7N50_02245, partial [Armatimonadota bacterium]|nr:hypothetical protein [Armatimonadota bacterium]
SYFKVELEFDWDGQAFKLEKDFDAKTERLTNICNGEELTERDAIHRRLAEMTGLGAEELFRATACVTQSNIAHINGKGKEQISDQLQSVITGGAEDTVATRAAASLQAKAADLRKGLDRPANNPGAIKEAQEYAERLKVELTAKKADHDRLLQATETVNAAGEDSEDRRRRLEAAQALLANYEKRAKLCAELEAASEAENAQQEEMDFIERFRQSIREKKQAAQSFSRFSEMPQDTPQALATLEATLRVHAAAEKTEEEELEKVASSAQSSRPPGFYLTAAGFVLSIIIGVIAGAMGKYLAALIAVVAAMAIGYLHQSKSAAARDASDRANEAEERLERIRTQLRVTYEEQQKLVKASGCSSAEELRKQWAEWSQIRFESAQAEAELAGKLAGRNIEALQKERKHLSKACRDIKENLDETEMKSADITPLERQQLVNEAQRLETELAELDHRRISAQAITETNLVDLGDIYALEEQLCATQERMQRLDRQARVYSMAADGIRDAVAKTLSGAKDQLESQIGKRLSFITGGKYDKVEVDERSLEFRIYSDEKNSMVDADGDELSRGTLDQFYLAARIAILDLVCGSTKPPVFLDDPFVTFDDDRSQHAMELCKQISRDRQTLLFTCSDRYDSYADNVIDLGK